MGKLVSKTYGDALFELAVEKGSVPSCYEQLLFVEQVLDENEELMKIMNNPRIIKEEKITMIRTIFEQQTDQDVSAFLAIIAEKNRFSEIREIITYTKDRIREYQRVGAAYVKTAVALDDGQKEAVRKKLLETTGYQSFEMHYTVEKELIGGMIIQIGQRVIDSSIRTKLNGLSKELLKVQL